MNVLIAFLKSLWFWFRRRHKISSIVQIDSRSELPEKLGRSLYVVGDPAKWAILQCPCGCGDTIDVNLMKARHPVWQLSLRDGKATFHPSLWVPEEKCGAHFWIRNGKIIWVDNQSLA